MRISIVITAYFDMTVLPLDNPLANYSACGHDCSKCMSIVPTIVKIIKLRLPVILVRFINSIVNDTWICIRSKLTLNISKLSSTKYIAGLPLLTSTAPSIHNAWLICWTVLALHFCHSSFGHTM